MKRWSLPESKWIWVAAMIALVASVPLLAEGQGEPKGGKAAAEPVTLNIWSISSYAPMFKELTDLYVQTHPNLTFNVTAQSDEFQDANVITTMASQSKDVDASTFWAGTRILKMVEDGSLLNLDSWFKKYNWEDKQDKAILSNKVPGFGHAVFSLNKLSIGIVYYNKDLYAKAGVTPPKTMSEFWSMCEKIKASGVAPFSVGNKEGWPGVLPWCQMSSRFMGTDKAAKYARWGLDPTTTAESAEILRSEGAVATWQFMADLSKKGYLLTGFNAYDFYEQGENFLSGKAASQFGFIPLTAQDTFKAKPGFPLGYYFMPGESGSNAIPMESTDVLLFPKNLPANKQAIFADFLDRMVTDKQYLAVEYKYSIPSSNVIKSETELQAMVGNPLITKILLDAAGREKYSFADLWLPLPCVKEFYDLTSKVFEGQVSPKEAAQSMYDRGMEWLKDETK